MARYAQREEKEEAIMDVLADVRGRGEWVLVNYDCSVLENKSNYMQYIVKIKLPKICKSFSNVIYGLI